MVPLAGRPAASELRPPSLAVTDVLHKRGTDTVIDGSDTVALTQYPHSWAFSYALAKSKKRGEIAATTIRSTAVKLVGGVPYFHGRSERHLLVPPLKALFQKLSLPEPSPALNGCA